MERFKWIPQSLHGGDQDREEDLLGEFEGPDSWSPLQVLHLLCRFRCLIANLSFVPDLLFLPLGQRLYGFAASLVIGFAFMLLVRCVDSWVASSFLIGKKEIPFLLLFGKSRTKQSFAWIRVFFEPIILAAVKDSGIRYQSWLRDLYWYTLTGKRYSWMLPFGCDKRPLLVDICFVCTELFAFSSFCSLLLFSTDPSNLELCSPLEIYWQ